MSQKKSNLKVLDPALYQSFESPLKGAMQGYKKANRGLYQHLKSLRPLDAVMQIKDWLVTDPNVSHESDYFQQQMLLLALMEQHEAPNTKHVWLSSDDVSFINSIKTTEAIFGAGLGWANNCCHVVHLPKGSPLSSFQVKLVEDMLMVEYRTKTQGGIARQAFIVDAEQMHQVLNGIPEADLDEAQSQEALEQAPDMTIFIVKFAVFLALEDTNLVSVLMKNAPAKKTGKHLVVELNETLKSFKRDSALHYVSTFVRQLKDDRYYKGDYADYPVGSRFAVVKGHLRGKEKNIATTSES